MNHESKPVELLREHLDEAINDFACAVNRLFESGPESEEAAIASLREANNRIAEIVSRRKRKSVRQKHLTNRDLELLIHKATD